MCDYSLHHIASRPAKVGDRLVTTKFVKTPTRGFSEIDNPDVAVCLLPGTVIAFDQDVECDAALGCGQDNKQRSCSCRQASTARPSGQRRPRRRDALAH